MIFSDNFEDTTSISSTNSSDNHSVNTQKLLNWETVVEQNVPKKGELILVCQQLKGRAKQAWIPATFVSNTPRGFRCKLVGSQKEVYKTPVHVKSHKIQSRQLVRHKGYLFRVVKLENDQSPECE